MKTKYLSISIICMAITAGLLSCSERLGEVEQPDFEVSVDKNTFEVGEEVVFRFKGAPSVISFYSGEPGNNYLYKDEGQLIDISGHGASMSFSTQLANTVSTHQTDQLSVWYSFDYNGSGKYADVASANWTDISDWFTLASNITSTASGEQDVSSLFTNNDPLYIGFKYVTKSQSEHQPANPCHIVNFTLKSNIDFANNFPVLITDQAHAGFRIIDQYPEEAPSRSTVNVTRITFSANAYYVPGDSLYDASSPWNDPETVTWAISKPIYKDTVRLSRDWASAIKGINVDEMSTYTYTYSTPGTYKVYFIAINSTINDVKYTVKELSITITP